MKYFMLAVLFVTLSVSVHAQTWMIIHQKEGTRNHFKIANVDSVTTYSQPVIGMCSVAGGTFTAGTTAVTITSFSIDKYEVTSMVWEEIRAWGASNGYSDLPVGSGLMGGLDPEKVFWYAAVKWCNARSEKDGLTPVYYTDAAKTTVYRTGEIAIKSESVQWNASGYRLPTEAEWEFAAKGGTLAHTPAPYTYSGSNTIGDVAWHSGNSGGTIHVVGAKSPNELGIYDMSGNAAEWCWDFGMGDYPSGGTTDPRGPDLINSNPYRIIRGGSYHIGDCAVTTRDKNYAGGGGGAEGFRCVCK